MMDPEVKRLIFQAIDAKRFVPPSHWQVKGHPKGWHMQRPCTPEEASMHDNGINDALMALNELKLKPEPTRPHDYFQSLMHMGDCVVCGHGQHVKIHQRGA